MSPIAVFHSPFPTKFGIPRQAGVVSDIPGTIIFEKPFRTPDAIRGMEGFDYIWIIWQAVSASSTPTVGATCESGMPTVYGTRPNALVVSTKNNTYINIMSESLKSEFDDIYRKKTVGPY